jgi:hypothetical protein
MKDQDVLEIVCDVSRELRFSPSFCTMLRKLDADEAQRVTRSYLEFLFKMLGADQISNDVAAMIGAETGSNQT